VKSGEVAYRLGKPYNYVLYLAADYLGEWFARFSLSIAIASGLALLFVGPIPFTAQGLASTLVLLAGAVALDFTFAAAISLLAFWVEDTSSIYLIYRRLVMLLGGMMIPLDVFPEPLSSIASALPFAYIVYGPARQFSVPSSDFFTDAILKISISLVAAFTILAIVYKAGQRGVTVNGG
jgi:ABC-2 type transport system permease protein